MLASLADRWWVFLIKGIAALIFGIIAFVSPITAVVTLTIVFGAFAFVNGVMALAAAVSGAAGNRWWVLLLEAIVSLIVAFFVWDQPVFSSVTLLYAIAFWAIFVGIMEIIAGIQMHDHAGGEWMYILSGIVSVIFGIWALRRPEAGALAIIWIIGIYAFVFGILQIGLSLRLNGLRSKLSSAAG